MKYAIFVLLLFCLTAQASANESVVLVTNEYLPYVNTSTREHGFLSETVIAALKAVGIEAKIEFRPWKRCAMLVEDGEVFGAFPYAKTQKRLEFADFSDPLWTCNNVFFFLKGRLGKFDYTNLDDLKRFVIAGTSGNYYEDPFKEAGLNVDYAPGEASGIRKVWEMRADLFAEDELVGWTLISMIFPNQMSYFGSTPTPWNRNPQHLMVSRKYPGAAALLARFNDGMKTIRKNGTFDRILRRYAQERRLLHD